MADKNLESISMMIITYSGVARSSALNAIDMAEEGKFNESDELIKEADENIKLAGKEHYDALNLEINGELKVNLLLIHAEDQMLSAETAIALSKKVIKLWREIKK